MQVVSDIVWSRKTHSFSFSVKNLESRGIEGYSEKPVRPLTMRIENNPSYTEVTWGCKRLKKNPNMEEDPGHAILYTCRREVNDKIIDR